MSFSTFPKSKETIPGPPAHLSVKAAALWRDILSKFELEAYHVELLTLACESLDRRDQARDLLAREGLVVTDPRGVQRPHPAVSTERNAGIMYVRVLRELNLDTAPDESRPPSLRNSGASRRR